MAEQKTQLLKLSDGSFLSLPDNMPDDQVMVQLNNAEQQLKAQPADDDGRPAVVDEPNGNWLHDNHPDIYNAGHEFLTGVAQGVGNLPNAVPNIVNNAQSLYDLNFGSGTGQVAPEDQWKQWYGPEGYVQHIPGTSDQTLEQLNPQTPGYEGTRQYGQMTGAALPAGPVAALVAPALSEGGGFVGDIIDKMRNDPNHTWRQNLSTAAPLILGLVRAPLAAVERSGVTPGPVAISVASQVSPAIAAKLAAIRAVTRTAKATSHGSMASDIAGSLRTQAGTLPYDHRRRD